MAGNDTIVRNMRAVRAKPRSASMKKIRIAHNSALSTLLSWVLLALLLTVCAYAAGGDAMPALIEQATLDKWSEPFQARLLEKHLSYLLGEREVAGVFVWQFADIRTISEYWSNRNKCLRRNEER
jgi:hypothetical protein